LRFFAAVFHGYPVKLTIKFEVEETTQLRSNKIMKQEIFDLASSFSLPRDVKVPTHQELIKELKKLESAFPGQIRLSFDGQSRKGKNLICVEIGNGERAIGITAGAHSDEPTGTVTSLYFAKALLENEKFKPLLQKFSFIIHPMIDPDGAEVNYAWASKEFSYREYFKLNYRNTIPGEDCEHGIPVAGDQTIRPELAFFKKNIDRYKGRMDFYITLHTTHRLGGSLFVVEAKEGNYSDKFKVLTKACSDFGIPITDLDLHGQDGMDSLAPGFIKAPSMASVAENYKDNPEILSKIKMTTYEYAQHELGTSFCLISELPYIVDEILADTGETEVDLTEVKMRDLKRKKKRAAQLQVAVEELKSLGITDENIWFRNALFTVKVIDKINQAHEKQIETFKGIKAKNYDVNDGDIMDLEEELKIPTLYMNCLRGKTEHQILFDRHEKEFNKIADKLDSLMKYKVVPLEVQVRVQVAMILAGI
jgi:hypothetical protein